jgi:cytosolic 5'-nucleotidase 3
MNYIDKFICGDKEKNLKKIEFFLKHGKEKIHLVLDFDRTLTKSQNDLGENVTTWEILKTHLPIKGQKEYQRLYNKYRPLEVKNIMKLSDAVIWWEKILDLYKKNKLRWSDIANDVEKRMPIRPGTKELFDTCEKKGIPIIIISAGIKDVIGIWCQKFKIKPTLILSTNLNFDSDGYIKGWDKNSLIHVLNKKEKGHQEVSKMKKLRPNIFLIGDSIDDAHMVGGAKKVLRIILDDPRIDAGRKGGMFYNKMLQKFDLIIKEKSLFPVVDIIKLF